MGILRNVFIVGDLDTHEKYPTHVCVPLGRGEVGGSIEAANACGLLANGQPILSQVETVMHWPDGSAKWQHVHASLRGNTKYEYYSEQTHDIVHASKLSIIEDVAQIEVDNGLIKILVSKAPSAGMVEISDSVTDEQLAVGSHFMFDERNIAFSIHEDLNAVVEIEFAGPQVVCIKISGWYQSREKRVPPFVLCCTRIYIFADSPVIKYDHGATFGANMNLHGIGQLGIDFAQARPYAIKLVGRELEKKFPYYITEENGTRATFWQWPGSNRVDNGGESQIAVHNLYKNFWLHSGPLLDPRLPNEYYDAWKNQTDTTECKAEYARAANMQGIMMHAQFGVLANSNFSMPFMEMYKNEPIGIIEPSEAVRTNVLGPIAPSEHHASGDIAAIDVWITRAALGNQKAIERYGDYGIFNYGNLHSNELMSQGRPSLHRVWDNGHYQQKSLWWLLFFRSANPNLLKFARISSDYYASIGTIRYDEMKGKPDGSPGPETKYHVPGGNYHTKGCLPWGGRDYGMDANDIDADLIGHWPDPTSNLYAWLIGAEANARDAYETWADNVQFRSSGWAREVNTSIVHAIFLYEYLERQDAALLAKIQGMRDGLMQYPLKDQAPGPIWHPDWLSVYSEAFPDDLVFRDWLIAQAPTVMPNIEGCWAMSLAATLTELTGDKSWIEKQFATITRAIKVLYNVPPDSPNKLWQNYGCKPGPSNDQHFMLQWPRLAAAYLKNGIIDLPEVYEPGNYLFGIARLSTEWAEDMECRGTHVLVDIPSQIDSFDITIDASTLSGGDIQGCSMYVKRPDGSHALDVPRLEISNNIRKRFWRDTNYEIDREVFTIETNGVSGLWEIVFGSDGIGLFQKLTQYPEAQRLQSLNGPMPFSGEQIRHKSKHGTVYLHKLAPETDNGFIHVKAMGERCGTCINGTWLKYHQTIALPNPTKLEIFSDGDGWAEIEIDYETRYPFLASGYESDLQTIAEKI